MLTLEPTGPHLLVLRDIINKAEERDCPSVAIMKKKQNPPKPVEEKQLVLPRTKIYAEGGLKEASRAVVGPLTDGLIV